MVFVYLMSLNSTTVLSRNTAKIYASSPPVLSQVISNQLGRFQSRLYQTCVLVQHLTLPIIYLMIIVYQVNYIVFKDAEESKNLLISLGIISLPTVAVFGVFFGNMVAKVSWANAGSFVLMVGFVVFVSVTKVMSRVKEFGFQFGHIYFNFEDEKLGMKTCRVEYLGSNAFIYGDVSYLVSIWVVLFNIISYASNCQYRKTHQSGFALMLTLLFFVCLAIGVASLPMMACNELSQKVDWP
jgi:tryptophan-rich sensory protein